MDETEVLSPEEMTSEDAAELSAVFATEKRKAQLEEEAKGFGRKRRRGEGPENVELFDSDIPYPVEVHGEDFEHMGPYAYAAEIPADAIISAYSDDQEFVIDPDKVKTLKFQRPNRNLPKKRLFNVKAIKPTGDIVQLPFEPQIQNTAGGNIADALGLRRYQAKGFFILMDFQTLQTTYCGGWDCWARALADGGPHTNFCGEMHSKHTRPNQGAAKGFGFGEGVTSSRVWSQ